MNITRKKVLSVLITLFSIVLGVVWLTPLIWLIGTALTETTFHMTFLPTTPFTLDNIKYVWNAVPFGQYYLNTIIVTVCITLGQIIIGSMAAYAFARIEFPGKNFLFGLIMCMLMMKSMVLMVLFSMQMKLVALGNWHLFVMVLCIL